MADDSQSIAPEEPGEDLGQQLVQRAAAPGVIRRDLAARIQRSCCVAETGLATEIQRRFAPASSSPWDQGPALPYAGFGGFGGSGGMASGGGLPPGLPMVQAKPASSSPAVPVARTVGAPAAGGAAAATLSPLGSSLQRRHLGTAQSGGVQSGEAMVQRRSLPGSPSAPTAHSVPTPVSPSIPTSSSMPLQRSSQAGPAGDLPVSSSSPRIQEGPAIVRRSIGSPAAPEMPLRRMSEPEEEKLTMQSAAPPTVQASPARTEMGPAIVHRSAMPVPVRRVSTAPTSAAFVEAPTQTSVQRAISPGSPISSISPVAPTAVTEMGSEMGLPLAQPARLQPAPAAAGMPVQRTAVSGVSSPVPHLPLVQAASGRGDAGSGIVQRAAGIALPLARQAQGAGAGRGAAGGAVGGGVVQRQTEGGSSLSAPATGLPGGTTPEAFAPTATGGTAAPEAPDLDDVVEQVMRRLKRNLVVESERHGGRRWP